MKDKHLEEDEIESIVPDMDLYADQSLHVYANPSGNWDAAMNKSINQNAWAKTNNNDNRNPDIGAGEADDANAYADEETNEDSGLEGDYNLAVDFDSEKDPDLE